MSIKNIFVIIVSLAVMSCTDKGAVNEHSGEDSVILPRVIIILPGMMKQPE